MTTSSSSSASPHPTRRCGCAMRRRWPASSAARSRPELLPVLAFAGCIEQHAAGDGAVAVIPVVPAIGAEVLRFGALDPRSEAAEALVHLDGLAMRRLDQEMVEGEAVGAVAVAQRG